VSDPKVPVKARTAPKEAASAGTIEKFNLRARLRFDLDAGSIWLDEQRMLLMHAKAFGALRKELYATLGARRAQGLLLRMGYVSGQHHARVAKALSAEGEAFDVYRIGPTLHEFEGLVKVQIQEYRADPDGEFYCTATLTNSWEAESHLEHFGHGEDCACWSLVGYASGFTTHLLGREVVFRETECVSQGQDRCRLIGRAAEAWTDDPYLAYFRAQNIENEFRKMEHELERLRSELGHRAIHTGIVGSAPPFRAALRLLEQAANSAINVLLLGETGVGKELFARWLHDNGPRASRPFVAVNCAAIPQELIESELFGVRKGAFTGAHDSRPGRFERADGGTLFLDEVGDLSPSAQVKLLRVLQTGEVERVGDDQVRKVDVRLVSATNVNLQEAIAERRFRADLYYRLATYPLTIPPLRERRGDLAALAAALIAKYEPVYNKKTLGLSAGALQALMAHPWPGNVRELENMIERGLLLVPSGGEIELGHLFADAPAQVAACAGIDRDGKLQASAAVSSEQLIVEGFDLAAHEASLLQAAVQRAAGNLAQAARLLGITRRQLAYRLERARVEDTGTASNS
jgi:two-component system response regulator HydG